MRKRDVQINFRLTQDEAKDLQEKIQKSGLRKELFMRLLIAGCKFTDKPDREFYRVMRELTEIVNVLNRLIAKAFALGIVDATELERQAENWARVHSEVQKEFF